jgi:alanyl-tRNA synthetase
MILGLPPIDLQVFHDNGYTRRQCRVTDLWFWTCDPKRETCGDTEEDEYTFIGAPIISGFTQRGRELKDSMREAFISFLEEREHTRIEPYPVLARWRDDIHLTIASIADFQPHVTSGAVEPPANPLAISQPCIRLNDVDAVGRSGRHLTTFEMMAHHVFNRPTEGRMFYWMEECVQYCHDLLCDTFAIDPVEVTYVENPWSGGGNAGAAVEVIVGGLELATLVFMDLQEDEEGDVEIKGVKYSEMPLQIIDTGYGLERFCWAAAGTPTIYEAIYPESVAWLKEQAGFSAERFEMSQEELDSLLGEMSRLFGIMNIEAGSDGDRMREVFLTRLAERGHPINAELFTAITDPLSRIYAIPDHMHALANMLGDGLVPSNAKAGYLARMIARRVLRMRDELGLEISLSDLANHHLDVNYPAARMKQTHEGLLTILKGEEERYNEMLRKGNQVVKTAIKDVSQKATELPDEILFTINDSHGIAPDLVMNIANNLGWNNLTLRTGFNAEMAERHAAMAKDAAKEVSAKPLIEKIPELPTTVPLYYEDVSQQNFEASVLSCLELVGDDHPDEATHGVILDRTCFYPEGGGQEGDYGSLTCDSASHSVLDTRKVGDLVVHLCSGPFEIGDMVHGELDWDRRRQLMDHHTAVHIVGGAARRLLGPHIYQAGANKSTESARLDITHHRRLSRKDLDEIEALANEVIQNVSRTEKVTLDRKDADRKYGFDLYQGGAPKGSDIRILRIADHDIQACGGTHHDEPGRIGQIRIIRSNAVQDGVERLHIVAGQAAMIHARAQEDILRNSADVFQVPVDELPAAANRFFTEWKDQRKRIEVLEAEIVRLRTSGGGDNISEINGIRVVVMEVDGDLKQMTKMLKELTLEPSKPTVAVLGSREGGGKLMIATTENSVASEAYNAAEILRGISSHINGGGGGRPTFAQGGGSNPDGLPAALDAAREIIGV